MEIVKYRNNQALFHQGEIATEMYEIISGQVGIYMDYGDEAQKEISILTEGDYVGELELIDSSTRIASAVALGNDVVVKKLSIEDFSVLVKENPAKVILIIQQLCARVRRLDNLYLSAPLFMVPRTGIEPARLAARAPETRASTIPPPGQKQNESQC